MITLMILLFRYSEAVIRDADVAIVDGQVGASIVLITNF
jgi:hypothetical protein